jgi:hypothetical protein
MIVMTEIFSDPLKFGMLHERHSHGCSFLFKMLVSGIPDILQLWKFGIRVFIHTNQSALSLNLNQRKHELIKLCYGNCKSNRSYCGFGEEF